MKFGSEKRARERTISVRMTERQAKALSGVASIMRLRSSSEAVRMAIDFWLQNDKEARSALRRTEKNLD